MRRAGAILLTVGLLATGSAAPSPGVEPDAVVTVDAVSTVGHSNLRLGGLGWNTGPTLEPVAPLRPLTVRIDASLESLCGVGDAAPTLGRLAPALERARAVRALGAQPLVILSYMPPCLAAPGFGDPTRRRPRDLDEWEGLVARVVTAFVEASPGPYRFEVWNEPDLPVFWQDTLPSFLAMALRTHRAVGAVAAGTQHRLEVGGPAAAFADPSWIVPYVSSVRTAGLPLDFVSWHHYGNSPFLGPDGNEGFIPELLYRLLAHRNPTTSPRAYGFQVERVREWVGAALAGSGLAPELVLDEWNVSAGGFDVRHDTHEGAAFAAGTLIEMERAGLDAADFYRAISSQPRGDWGLVFPDGSRKPAWWVFRAWRATKGARVETLGDDPARGLWARATRGPHRVDVRAGPGRSPSTPASPATRGPHRVDVLLASFAAAESAQTDRLVRVVLRGACAERARLAVIAAPGDSFEDAAPVEVVDGGVTVTLPRQSVAWVRFRTTPCP